MKTLINTYNLRKHRKSGTVDVRDIGENLVPRLLRIVDGTEICLFTGRYNFIGLTEAWHSFIVDDKYELSGTAALSLKLAELRCKK